MKIIELYQYLDEMIPQNLSCEWDNDGLMCNTDENIIVKKVLCTLDVTEIAVNYAVENNFDTIISHHPLIFKSLNSLNCDNNVARKLFKLVQNNITVMSFHTRLDAVENGVNDIFSKKLGLNDIRLYGNKGEEFGKVGSLSESMPLQNFVEKVKSILECEFVSVVDSGNEVKKIALVGGDGKDFFNAACKTGADTFITGSLNYNTMIDAREYNINVIEAGHFYTENFVCKYLGKLVTSLVKDVTVEQFNSNFIKFM